MPWIFFPGAFTLSKVEARARLIENIPMDTLLYLKSTLLPALDEDVVQVAGQHLGRFAVPRSVLCYADHLGHIAYGLADKSTERAVRFIREFFPARYSNSAELMVQMWRHGLVHGHMPRSLSTVIPSTGRTVNLLWLSTTHDRARERGLHLLTLPIQNDPNSAFFVVNNPQLGDDLIEAVLRFSKRLERDPSLESACDLRVAKVGAAQLVSEIKGSEPRVTAIGQEVIEAWNGRGGLIDQRGEVLERHPKEPH